MSGVPSRASDAGPDDSAPPLTVEELLEEAREDLHMAKHLFLSSVAGSQIQAKRDLISACIRDAQRFLDRALEAL